MSLNTIMVTGNYQTPLLSYETGGQPPYLSGYVLFTPTSDLIDTTTSTIYKAVGCKATLADGVMQEVVLIGTDSTDLVPVNAIAGQEYTWLWEIQEFFSGFNSQPWYAEIPSTLAQPVDLTTLTRLSAPVIG